MRRALILAAALLGAAPACGPTAPAPAPPVRPGEGSVAAEDPVPPDPEEVQAAEAVRELVAERTRAVEAAPRDGAAWLALGMAYDAHQLFHQADLCYEASVRFAPENAKAWYHLARARAELSRVEDAVDAMERSIRLRDDYAPSHWHRGLWLLDLGRPQEAEEAFERAVALDPDDDAGTIGLARVALERGDGGRAAELLEGVLRARPENGYARQLLAAADRQLGRPEDAQRELERSQYARPVWRDSWKAEVDALGVSLLDRLDRLRARIRAGQGRDAIPELEAMLEEDPANIAILSTLTPAYVQSGMFDRAREVNLAALRVRPDHFRIHMNLSLLAAQAGDLDEALRQADRAVELNPAFADGHLHRARLLLAKGRSELPRAVEALEESLRCGGPKLSTSMILARALLDLGRPEEAARVLERAAEAEPSASAPLAFLAAVRAKLGQVDAAWTAWRAARDLGHDPENLAAIEAELRALEEAGR